MPRRPWSGWTESCSRWAPSAERASMRHEPDRRVAGHQHDQRGRELLHRARAGQRPDAEGSNSVSAAASRAGSSASSSGRADGPDGPADVGGPPGDGSVSGRARRRLQRAGAALAAAGGGAARPDARARARSWSTSRRPASTSSTGSSSPGSTRSSPRSPSCPGSEVAGRVVGGRRGVSTGLAVGDRVLASVGPGRLRQPRRRAGRLGCRAARRPRRGPGGHVHPELQHQPVRPARAGPGAAGRVGARARAPAAASGWPPSAWPGRSGCRVLGVASSEDKRRGRARRPERRRCSTRPPSRSRTRRGPGRAAPASTSWSTPSAAPSAEPSLRALGDGGRYLVIGFASGAIPAVPLNQVLLRNRTRHRHRLGHLGHAARRRAARAAGDLLAMVADGTLDPVHPAEYPLDDVAGALEDLLGRRTVGKIALLP